MPVCIWTECLQRKSTLQSEKEKNIVRDSGPQNNGLSHLFLFSFVSGPSAEDKVSNSLFWRLPYFSPISFLHLILLLL